MKRMPITLAAAILAAGFPALASAQPMAADVDTSEWACEYCPHEDSFFGQYLIGIGYVSDDAFKFADFTGLEDGLYGVVGGWAIRSDEKSFWRIRASDLGLDSRNLSVEGGQPGRYNFEFEYDEIPRLINATGRTPFANPGSGSLDLVSGWTTAPRTDQMPLELLQPFELRHDRDRLRLGFQFTPPGRFEYDVSYSRDSREGSRALGAGFMFTSAVLPAPVDYVTDSVEAGVTYLAGDWQARVAYHGSFFENDARSVTWENPFNPVFFGATSGQLDLGPDNESHMVSVTGNYRGWDKMGLRGSVSFGEASQDDRFLPYTLNPENIFRLQPLPATNADAEVDVFNVLVKLDTEVTDRLDVDLTYRRDDRDNKTPQRLYSPVTQDLYVNRAQFNRPFSYKRVSLEVDARYRFSKASVSAGAEVRDTERFFDTRVEADEEALWGRAQFSLGNALDVNLEAVRRERDGEMLERIPGLEPTENPLLRKFYLADRDRDEFSAVLSVIPREWLQITYTGRYASDDYDRSLIGLTEADSMESTLDFAVFPSAGFSIHAFYSNEEIESEISGSSEAREPDWFGETEDSFDTAGLGFEVRNIKDKGIDFSADYVYSRSDGEYQVVDGSTASAFPELRTRLEGLRFRLRVPLKEGSDLHVDLYHEEYESSDWALDGVDPETVFNVLNLGELAHNYDVDTLSIWYRKGF